MTNGNDSAMPLSSGIIDLCASGIINVDGKQPTPFGLTKREYFAAMAMQGFCAAGYGDFKQTFEDHIAQLSVKQADILIKELNKEGI